MKSESSFIVHDGVVVPESALLRREQRNKCGSVPGLPDEELADPDELERQVYIEEFGPLWQLPVRGRKSSIRPNIDESGEVDWGAFASVDFERHYGSFDKLGYKLERLREERRDVLILFSVVMERLPSPARYQVLKYLRLGIIQPEHVTNEDVLALARLQRRAEKLAREIQRLVDARHARAQKALAKLLGD
jgi:hypothetical protein